MITGTTRNGFEFSLADDAMDDMELVELLARVQEDDPLVLGKMVEQVLGKDQKAALYDYLRSAQGKVKVSAVTETLEDIFAAFGDVGKKS